MNIVIAAVQEGHVLAVWLIRFHAPHEVVAVFALGEYRVGLFCGWRFSKFTVAGIRGWRAYNVFLRFPER